MLNIEAFKERFRVVEVVKVSGTRVELDKLEVVGRKFHSFVQQVFGPEQLDLDVFPGPGRVKQLGC